MSKNGNNGNNGRCLFQGLCCCYAGFDCSDIEFGCRGESEIICLKHAFCLSATAFDSLGCGLTTERHENSNEICKIGLFCCDFGIVQPKTVCQVVSNTCCLYNVTSIPLDKDYVDRFVCAYYGLACAPECGCCVRPPDCPAYDKMKRRAAPYQEAELVEMDRGGFKDEEDLKILK
eukprot:CAMPEP_0197184110 /NCGR_PEP_ID=MMETSP1423-20130617/9205_1 /TAXON_ID=476441 /ORGANISM="Pseudo-nitzschia heimii, Strain UNC1101" /LENGTH=174 /DNA_ID=CAMNT_0042634841 /DNA_START=215 /DNA_END=739 /DNA_ORIENTATION=-